MSERVIICSSAKAAAQFCHEERALQLHATSASSSRGRDHQRRGRQHGRGRRGHRGPKDGKIAKNNKNDSQRWNLPKRPMNLSFYQGRLLVGDSVLVRAVRASGGFVSKNNLTCFGGATTSAIIENLKNSPTNLPGKATVLVGTNDLMKQKERDDVVAGVRNVVAILKEKGVDDILLVTIPPPWRDLKRKFEDYAHVNEKIEMFESDGVKVVKIHHLFLKYDGNVNDDLFERFYTDGRQDLVHPNEKGLLKIIAAISCPEDCRSTASSETNSKMDTTPATN